MQEEARRQGGGRGGGRGNAFERGKQEEEEYAQHSWGHKAGGVGEDADEGGPKEEKSFALSGLLAAETRTFDGIELKFIEPGECLN